MSVFGHAWGDIDRTPPETPYVVDSDGWGWFMIFLLLALPFFLIGIFLTRAAALICSHPYISMVIYLLFSFLIGGVLYIWGNKKRKVFGLIATLITLLPLATVEGLYLIPYILQSGLFTAVFEWILVTAVVGGITFFILAIANVLNNGVIHFIISLVFCGLVCLILFGMLRTSKEINWTVIRSIYSL